MAHFDTLTELPNRAMIHERLAHAVSLAERHRTLVGVVFVDLDNFKTVNDGLGHAAGDNLLQQVAHRLSQRVRQEDTLGRLGGDEFILVLEHLRHPQQAAHVAQAMLDTLNQPFTLDSGQQVYVRASIGISMYPEDGTDASELIRDADAAMYESKRRGRNNFSFYTSAFTTDATSRLHLETRLRRAVEHGEFVLHYQPLVRLTDRKVVALEALVRLKTPEGALETLPPIGPDEFIPVMEDTGMIVALGEWVLNEACRQGKAWLDAGIDFGRLSVNLSPSEVRRGGVVERVSRILNRTGLPAHRLELEITESGLMESSGGAEQFLHMLHGLGVSLSIDDFGTGYSSLAYLKRFPVHQLKIDRSFIQDVPGNSSDAQLVQTMIALARGMNLNVVAEGVEMPDQEAFLSSLGCDIAQGYLYSRPVPADQIEVLFHDSEASEKSTIVR
jgi:diguanylate cyclase (GGDEF)-like protein